MIRLLLWSTLLLVGCGPRTVTVRVTIPDLAGVETPLSGFTISFLPYDRDSVLASLEANAGPRPHQRELDSLFRAFRGPFLSYLLVSDSATRARVYRDSVVATIEPTARDTSTVLRNLQQTASDLGLRALAARAALDRARNELFPSITAYRKVVSAWDDSVFRDYRKVTRSLADRIFANPVADTTDPLGWATVTLTDGDWWVTARSIDPTDPNAEWYWNVRIDRDTVHLDPRTGRLRPRY
ncbi:MAG: hypothetical protein SFV24_04640 [Gemmatimonadales bacterium]|nr:hypothetical protein [Gemmatimonadales bacterium]